jgi:hypothetical protein
MGTRITSLDGYPNRLGTLVFLLAFRDGNLIGHTLGTGTAEPLGALRCGGSFHKFGVPLGKVRGCLGGWSVAGRMRPRGSRLSKDALPSGFFFSMRPRSCQRFGV